MRPPAPLLLQAVVAPSEDRAVISAAEQLVSSLNRAWPSPAWRADVAVERPGKPIRPLQGATALLLSLLTEAEHADEPISRTAARWNAIIQSLGTTNVPVYVLTIFRHVPDRARDGRPTQLLERIRMLNRMAIDLSHGHGLGVIDIDRAFSHLGAQRLKTDWRMGGSTATEAAGHVMAWSLLSHGLDHAVDPGVQQKARNSLGSIRDIDAVISGRLLRHLVGGAKK